MQVQLAEMLNAFLQVKLYSLHINVKMYKN